MKLTRLLEILTECQDVQGNSIEGADCETCPLGDQVEVTPALEGYGSISGVTLRLSPCLLITEIAERINGMPPKESKGHAQH